MSAAIARALGAPLDWEVRQSFERAQMAMWRDLDYLTNKNGPKIRRVIAAGWSTEKLRAIAVLSAFSRVVLGPLAAAMDRSGGVALGHEKPVIYGTTVRIETRTNEPVRHALEAFQKICQAYGIKEKVLFRNRMADIVHALDEHSDAEAGV